jgi:hypothetical protein
MSESKNKENLTKIEFEYQKKQLEVRIRKFEAETLRFKDREIALKNQWDEIKIAELSKLSE